MSTEARKAIRDHDRARRKERWAMNVMHWFVRHGWVSGMGLAGYGLAQEGYTDYPSIEPDEFSIRRTGAGNPHDSAGPSTGTDAVRDAVREVRGGEAPMRPETYA